MSIFHDIILWVSQKPQFRIQESEFRSAESRRNALYETLRGACFSVRVRILANAALFALLFKIHSVSGSGAFSPFWRLTPLFCFIERSPFSPPLSEIKSQDSVYPTIEELKLGI
ncbi:hypothetical protein [Nostoc sp.]|uniref:hypothetical protein n=1 Tax=Nostoc sp. TaxID=1180 RepID=UPI002FFA9144